MKIKISITKIRNSLHDHPLLRKGGVHDKAEKTKRRSDKQKLKNEWRSLMTFLNSIIKEPHLYQI